MSTFLNATEVISCLQSSSEPPNLEAHHRRSCCIMTVQQLLQRVLQKLLRLLADGSASLTWLLASVCWGVHVVNVLREGEGEDGACIQSKVVSSRLTLVLGFNAWSHVACQSYCSFERWNRSFGINNLMPFSLTAQHRKLKPFLGLKWICEEPRGATSFS